jgi:hypothetical protein
MISSEIDRIAELQARRKFYISITNKQTNAAKALVCRVLGYNSSDDEKSREASWARAGRIVSAALNGKDQKPEDKQIADAIAFDLSVIAQGIEPFVNARGAIELSMKKAVRALPVYPWAKDVKGLGDIGLAVILGEAGDLSNYPKKGHLWKRLGLAPIYGRACSTWRREGGLSAEEWKDDGPNGPKYAPARLAQIFACVSAPMSKAQVRAKEKSTGKHGDPLGPYGEIYVRRQFVTDDTHPDWKPMHKRMDALRVMTKYMLRDLWAAWRKADVILLETAKRSMPSAETNERKADGGSPKRAMFKVPTVHSILAEIDSDPESRATADSPRFDNAAGLVAYLKAAE